MANLIDAKDLRGKRTDNLVDAVPLPAPWTMFLEPTNACNFRCKYCPTGDPALLKRVGRKVKMMDYDLFIRIVDQMREFPKRLRMLNLYKDGEPLLHPRFVDMVRHLVGANVSERIWVKTNGALLTPEYNQRLVSCGLDMIGISVQGVTAQAFYDVSGVRIDYDQYRANVADLFERSRDSATQISVKIADIGQPSSEKSKFLEDFGGISDFLAIEGLHGWSASDQGDWRMGTQNSFDGTPRTEKVACPLTLYMLTVNANGKVSICNDDWMQAHDIGDLNTDHLLDVWQGMRLKAFRMMHLEGRRGENAACKTCDYLAALPDNIDGHREEIINALR